jgi:hypothetical protein
MNYADQLAKMYECEGHEIDVEKDNQKFLEESFWSCVRANLYKKICKGKGGGIQWAYITGKRSYDSNNYKISLTEKNIKLLENTAESFNTEEGLNYLKQYGVYEVPQNSDDLITILQQSKTKSDIKKEEFKLFLKHKERLIEYIVDNL